MMVFILVVIMIFLLQKENIMFLLLTFLIFKVILFLFVLL